MCPLTSLGHTPSLFANFFIGLLVLPYSNLHREPQQIIFPPCTYCFAIACCSLSWIGLNWLPSCQQQSWSRQPSLPSSLVWLIAASYNHAPLDPLLCPPHCLLLPLWLSLLPSQLVIWSMLLAINSIPSTLPSTPFPTPYKVLAGIHQPPPSPHCPLAFTSTKPLHLMPHHQLLCRCC